MNPSSADVELPIVILVPSQVVEGNVTIPVPKSNVAMILKLYVESVTNTFIVPVLPVSSSSISTL